jgi:hypothetical protein
MVRNITNDAAEEKKKHLGKGLLISKIKTLVGKIPSSLHNYKLFPSNKRICLNKESQSRQPIKVKTILALCHTLKAVL